MAKTLYGEYGYTAPQTITLPPGLYLFELYGAKRLDAWRKGLSCMLFLIFRKFGYKYVYWKWRRTAYDGSNFNGGGQGGRGGAGGVNH